MYKNLKKCHKIRKEITAKLHKIPEMSGNQQTSPADL